MSDTIASRIRTIRCARNMSQKELAKAAEISTVAMYQIEAGKYEPRVVHLKKFADTLNVSMDYLAGRTSQVA